jgi:hypothetical protein
MVRYEYDSACSWNANAYSSCREKKTGAFTFYWSLTDSAIQTFLMG